MTATLSPSQAAEYGIEPDAIAAPEPEPVAAPASVKPSPVSFRQPQRLPESTRPLPAALESEMAVLGSILLQPSCSEELKDITQEDFHHPAYRTIWNCLRDMGDHGKPIDLVTVTQEMADRNLLQQIGGPVVLANLQTFLPTAVNVRYYADILREKSMARALIKACDEASESAYNHQAQPVSDIVMLALSKLEPLTLGESRPATLLDAFSMGTIPFPKLKEVGIPPRRKIIGEWFLESDLGFIFAPRGLGKTWFSLGLARQPSSRGLFTIMHQFSMLMERCLAK